MRKIVLAAAACALALGLTGAPATAVTETTTAKAGNTVRAFAVEFSPRRKTIDAGQRVRWKNVKGSHTVTMRKGRFSKALNDSTGPVKKRFRKPGTFRYYCIPHESLGMTGKVIVE